MYRAYYTEEELIAKLKELLKISPEDIQAEMYYFLGLSYKDNGNDKEARMSFNKIIQDFPDSSRVLEAKGLLEELKDKLDSENFDDYIEVFYGSGKYPNWSGYTIGYNLITKYLEGKENVNWNDLLRKNPKEILKESGWM